MRNLLLTAIASVALLVPSLSSALEPKEAGEIDAQMAEKEAAVHKQFGDRPMKDLSPDERREMKEKVSQAREEVLEQHGTNEKDYFRNTFHMNQGAHKEVEASAKEYKETKAAEAKKAADAKAAKPEDGAGQIKVQKGFDEKSPPADGKGGSEGVEIPVPGADKGGAGAAPAGDAPAAAPAAAGGTSK